MEYTSQDLDAFYKAGKVIDRGFFHEMIEMNDTAMTFHPKNCRLHIEKDNFFCGMRGDTFVIIEGFCEWDNYDVILIIANHKGTLGFTMIQGNIIEPKDTDVF